MKITSNKPKRCDAKRTEGSQQRVVMPLVKLSTKTVQRIGDQLHGDIQFYDEHGQPANAKVIQQIEDSLSGAGQAA